MKAFFNQLFDYNYDCNKKIIDECVKIDELPEKSVKLFSHILNAHHIWNARVNDLKPKYEVFHEHSITDWEEIHYDNQRSSFEIMSKDDDLERRIVYENSKGMSFTNTLHDILFHIINHSTHHRGQINLNLRESGFEPLSLDYIFYKR